MSDSPEVLRLNSRLATMIRERLKYDRTPPYIQQQYAKTIAQLDKSIEKLKGEKETLRAKQN